jgi:5-bromo-4-chloroindolyl phosphate hydrolysis protein
MKQTHSSALSFVQIILLQIISFFPTMWNVITMDYILLSSFSELFLELFLFSGRSYLFYFNLLYKKWCWIKEKLETALEE